MTGVFPAVNAAFPPAADPEALKTGMERWRDAISAANLAADWDAAAGAPDNPSPAARLLESVFGGSPYLTRLCLREAGFVLTLFAQGPDKVMASILDEVSALAADLDEKSLIKALRVAKRRAALLIAMADIAGDWTLEQVTGALTQIAEATLEAALRHAMGILAARGRLSVEQPGPTEALPGFVFLGMGKFGSGELNYSSDIDLIALYDERVLNPDDPDRLRQDMVRMTQSVVRIMESRTGDGYVFRTDLRLRPDPGLTPVAITVSAAEQYYESVGQNWERAAMIKARPVAGDKALGQSFLDHIRPFVWRKHLDFAAVADVHSIKRQINAHRGGAQIAIEGHNIKLGRGGIREIEFYGQTQQLIWGGRQPGLRQRETLAAIAALKDHGHVGEDALNDLTDSYLFLRQLEHRLQMVNDEQTQKLPATPEGIAQLGRFMGFETADSFRSRLLEVLGKVQRHYAALFEDEPDLGAGGSLVFTGQEDHPDTIATLQEMGFEDPSHVSARVRAWHHGRYRSTRSERSRQILTELMPHLLKSLSQTTNPGQAFNRFDSFISELPSGVQIFSLFHSNPAILDMVAEIMGNAPRLADWLTRRPILLDGVISDTPDLEQETLDDFGHSLDANLAQANDFQDILDIARRWANDRRFQIGVKLLYRDLDGESAGPILSGVAETAISRLVPSVEKDFCPAHGGFPKEDGTGFAVIAFGKLGGRELAPMSDVDLVYVYRTPEEAAESDGKRPLTPMVYFTRLCQRLTTAITAQTPEGSLYEVDNRLRPNGRKGPLATQFETFRSYYDGSSWTWEEMALTRARVICAPDGFRSVIEATIRDVLCRERDADALVVAIDHMRRRIAEQHPGTRRFDLKYRPGGLIDIEFIAQYLQLRHAADHPGILSANTGQALENLAAEGLLDPDAAGELKTALTLWRNLQAVLRLTADERFDADTAPDGQKKLLAQTGNTPGFAALEELVDATAETARAHYNTLLAGPADGRKTTSSYPE